MAKCKALTGSAGEMVNVTVYLKNVDTLYYSLLYLVIVRCRLFGPRRGDFKYDVTVVVTTQQKLT